jgi:ABC-type nitrate/sulfonate/bicarbonate transport system substrate-binding protein
MGNTIKALAALLITAAFACRLASPAQAQTPLVVAKVADDFALMMGDYGNTLGVFKRRGLDVQFPLITQAKMVQAVIAGSVDMALGSGATIAFAAKGAPLKAVASIDGPPRLLVLVVPPNGKVRTVDDLKGSTVAISNLGSLTDWLVAKVAAMKGWAPADIRRAGVGDTPARVAAMRTGSADAAVMDIAAAYELEDKGQAKILVNFGEFIKDFDNQVIYAADACIKTKPDAVRGLVAGYFETLGYARTHRDETLAFAEQNLNVSASVAGKVYDALMVPGFFSTDGRIDPAIMAAMSQSFVSLKLLPQPEDLMAYVDQSFLPPPR